MTTRRPATATSSRARARSPGGAGDDDEPGFGGFDETDEVPVEE